MSNRKPKQPQRQTAALEALRQNMALIKKGNDVYGLHVDGTRELLSSSKSKKEVWGDVLAELNKRAQSSAVVKSTSDVASTTKLRIYSDGGSRGNPGPSAAGYVIMTDDETHILERGGKYLGVTTNNQAEYQAVKLALEAAVKFKPKKISFFVDSLLVVNQLNGLFKVKNKELWPIHEAINSLKSSFDKVEFTHVRREKNQLADDEVNIILDAKK